jgi:hypothetical protein
LVMAFFQGIAEYSLVMFIIGIAKKYINVMYILAIIFVYIIFIIIFELILKRILELFRNFSF